MAQHDENLEAAEAAKAAKAAEKAAKRAAKESAKAAKSAKSAPTATPTATVSAPSGTAPIKGNTGSDASGFVVWRGERYAGVAGFVPGAAGADHEIRKMIGSGIARASAMVEESDEHGKLAATLERKSHLAGNMEEKELLAEMAITERAMASVKLYLAEQILSEVESCDVGALARRYRDAGNSELTTETVIAFHNGTFGGAEVNASGVPVNEPGETFRPLTLDPSTMDERRARCRKALANEAEKNSAPVESAPLANVSEADREAELARLLAESAADDTTEILEYLE